MRSRISSGERLTLGLGAGDGVAAAPGDFEAASIATGRAFGSAMLGNRAARESSPSRFTAGGARAEADSSRPPRAEPARVLISRYVRRIPQTALQFVRM